MGKPHSREELGERVEALEGMLNGFVKGDLTDRVEALAQRVTKLEQENEVQAEELSALQNRLDLFTDLAEDAQSTPALRATHIRDALVKRAEAGDGHATMTYAEVADTLTDRGHGQIHRPQAYQAIEDAAAQEGFQVTTAQSTHGNEVRAIGVNLERIRDYTPRNEIITREEAEGGSETPSTTLEATTN